MSRIPNARNYRTNGTGSFDHQALGHKARTHHQVDHTSAGGSGIWLTIIGIGVLAWLVVKFPAATMLIVFALITAWLIGRK